MSGKSPCWLLHGYNLEKPDEIIFIDNPILVAQLEAMFEIDRRFFSESYGHIDSYLTTEGNRMDAKLRRALLFNRIHALEKMLVQRGIDVLVPITDEQLNSMTDDDLGVMARDLERLARVPPSDR